VYDFIIVFYSNFVPKTHCFWDIRLQKCRDLENWVKGLSFGNVTIRCIAYDFLLAFYSNDGSTSCRLWDIQCRKNVFTLKSQWEVTQGHRKWYHSVDCMVDCRLMFYNNFVGRCTVFEIFDFKNAATFKTGLGVRQCHWKWPHSIERIRHRKWCHSIYYVWFPISVL